MCIENAGVESDRKNIGQKGVEVTGSGVGKLHISELRNLYAAQSDV
jgi:hypothetical protein